MCGDYQSNSRPKTTVRRTGQKRDSGARCQARALVVCKWLLCLPSQLEVAKIRQEVCSVAKGATREISPRDPNGISVELLTCVCVCVSGRKWRARDTCAPLPTFPDLVGSCAWSGLQHLGPLSRSSRLRVFARNPPTPPRTRLGLISFDLPPPSPSCVVVASARALTARRNRSSSISLMVDKSPDSHSPAQAQVAKSDSSVLRRREYQSDHHQSRHGVGGYLLPPDYITCHALLHTNSTRTHRGHRQLAGVAQAEWRARVRLPSAGRRRVGHRWTHRHTRTILSAVFVAVFLFISPRDEPTFHSQ